MDAGRLGLTGFPEPLVYAADLCLLTMRSDLVSLSGARSWAQTLRAGSSGSAAPPSLGLLMVGEGDPYTAREVREGAADPRDRLSRMGSAAAQVFGRGAKPPRKIDTSPLVRSLPHARDAIDSTGHRQPRTSAGHPPSPMGARA